MGLEGHSFSFFPFGALFCLTLFSFVAIRLVEIRQRYKADNYQKKRESDTKQHLQ